MAKYIVCPQDGYPTLLEEIGMRKITPIILTMIMLMSAFASIGWSELDETKTSNEADARAGPDAQITAISEPRATSVDALSGDMQHTIDAGSMVNFELFIENVGDAAITQLGITVTVHEDADGQPGGALGPVATDASGAALIWQNNDVICDDAFACPQTSLAAGAVLDGGSYLMVVQGTIVSWLPEVGDYQIKVDIDAKGANDVADVEPDNDMMLQYVSVVDWTDVIVDLRWFSGKDVEGGSGAKDFTLTVSTTGSIAWEARNITLELELSGELASAAYWTDADGDNQTDHDGHGDNTEEQSNTLATDGTPFVFDEVGTFESVTTYEAGDDRSTNTTDNRWNMRMGDVWTVNGTVIPSSAVNIGTYQIEVLMTGYTIYGQYSPECDRESNQTGDADEDTLNTTLTVTDFCEVSKLSDDNPSTSEDMIEGDIENYHDMSITNLVINQGYGSDDLDGNGFPASTSADPGLLEGPIQPGLATVQAKVNHNGNDPSGINGAQQYTWNVTFDITSRATGVVTSLTSNECFNGEIPGGISYTDVGGSGPTEADACAAFMFTPGTFDVVATVTFEHRGTAGVDQNGFNDKMQIGSLAVLNNRPTVSLNIGTEGNIIVGEDTEVQFEADAYDIEDPTGSNLIYNWTYPGAVDGGELGSMTDGQGKDFSVINLNIFGDEWVGYQSVSVTVSDSFSTTSATVSFNVWNHVLTDSTTASGVKMTYDLTYAVSNPYTVTLSDSDTGYTGQTLVGYTGTYDSVAVLDFTPSTSYDGTYVLNQAVSIEYNSADFDPTSVWYVDTNGIWAEISQSTDTVGTVSTITLDLGSGAGTLSPGMIVLMGGTLIQAEPPTAHPMGFTMAATTGGNIGMAWTYMGSYVAEVDWVEIVLCEGASGCADPEIIKPGITMTAHSLSGQGQTTHGVTYHATIQVCNDAGCNGVIGQANATADREVDGHPTASAVTVANGDNVWTVSWTANGDTSDVKNWMVCYDDSSWTVAGDMPLNCVNAADGATSADIPMSTAPGKKKFYFTAVPVDALGNSDNAVSMADVDYVGAADGPGQGTGEDVGSTTDVEGAVPAWTWGVIIGVVVVAFVAGAFILSRGGEGDEGKDWDY